MSEAVPHFDVTVACQKLVSIRVLNTMTTTAVHAFNSIPGIEMQDVKKLKTLNFDRYMIAIIASAHCVCLAVFLSASLADLISVGCSWADFHHNMQREDDDDGEIFKVLQKLLLLLPHQLFQQTLIELNLHDKAKPIGSLLF